MRKDGKTLSEVMKDFDENQILHIGASSGFFFVGTKVEWAEAYEKIQDRMFNASRTRLAQYWKTLNKAKREIIQQNKNLSQDIDIYIHSLSQFIVSDMQNTSLKREIERHDTIQQKLLKISNAMLTIAKTKPFYQKEQLYIKSFETLNNREVLEVYDRLQGDGTVIIVNGLEMGDYWNLKEYQYRHKGDKDEI